MAQYDRTAPDISLPNENLKWLSADVPGAVHYDLIKAGLLENIYAGTEAAFASAWVAKSDWLYRAEFDVSNEFISGFQTFMLRFNGIDTFSEIWLNGKLLGETANAYRTHEFQVASPLLLSGENVLLVRVKAHERMISEKIEEAQRLGNGSSVEGKLGKALIRRYQRSFFTVSSLLNLGTGVLGMGLIRNIELCAYKGAYLSDLSFRTTALHDSSAEGELLLCLENTHENAMAAVLIQDEHGVSLFAENFSVRRGDNLLKISLENPKLWWPAGYGKPHLYNLKVNIIQNDSEIFSTEQKIGIRTIRLVKKEPNGRKTFYFEVNGKKIFVHGQNYIPLDYIKVYGSREEYDRLFRLIKEQNVNLIRMWGGGAVEEPDFYSRCDSLGIMVWQDMFLHSNTYPDYDEEFVQEFLAEAEGVIRQVRRHPCLCLICGGNEQQEGWDEWGWKQSLDRFYGEKLIKEHLPDVAEKLCPDLPYIYNSPHGGKWAQSPVEGECHNWGNFYNSTKDPLFVTETCWTSESYSRPETLKKYMNLDVDEFEGNDWSAKWQALTSLPLFNSRPYSSWNEVDSLRTYLQAQEIEQMRADYSALSMFRFRSPSNSGIIYWSMNKGGPLFQFGCVDYGGYPLMSYYAVKRVFSPIAVNAYRDADDVFVMLSSHADAAEDIMVSAIHLNNSGKLLGEWSAETKLNPGDTKRAICLDGLYSNVEDRTRETVYVTATKDGRIMAEDMLFFCPFSEYEGIYSTPELAVEKTGDDEWHLNISTNTPARLITLESNDKLLLSDNYFPLAPGTEKKVRISLLEKADAGATSLTVCVLGSEEEQKILLG